MVGQAAEPKIPSLHKAAEMLALFSAERPKMTLAEMTQALSWDKATTHRFATELEVLRFLDRLPEGSYTLGSFCLQLGETCKQSNRQQERLRMVVDTVADITGLTTQVGVLEGQQVTVVMSTEGRGNIRAIANLGGRLPLFATGLGKMISSQLTTREVKRLLPKSWEPFTASTLKNNEALFNDLADIRKRGHAVSDSELSEGLYVIALPLPPSILAHPAAICCAGPPPTIMGTDVWDKALTALAEAVDELQNWSTAR